MIVTQAAEAVITHYPTAGVSRPAVFFLIVGKNPLYIRL
jgi:hypothetical protein